MPGRLTQFGDSVVLLTDHAVELFDFSRVVALLVFAKQKQVSHVLWSPVVKVQLVLLHDRSAESGKLFGIRVIDSLRGLPLRGGPCGHGVIVNVQCMAAAGEACESYGQRGLGDAIRTHLQLSGRFVPLYLARRRFGFLNAPVDDAS